MKTFKKLTALVLALVMCIALCSCTVATNMKINADGTVKATLKYTLSETELSALKKAMGDDGSFDEFTKESDKKGLTETIDGVKYYSMVEDSEVASVDEMNEGLTAAGKYTATDFWIYASSASNAEAGDYDAIFKETGINMHVSYTLTFAHKIVETNCPKVDDYSVSFDETFDGKYVYAITEKSTADWTRAEDKVAAFKEMAKIQYTPKKVKGVKVVYKNAKALSVSWREPSTFFISGFVIERKVGKGAWEEFKKVNYLSLNYDDTYRPCVVDKTVKAGKTYSYRVKALYQDEEFDLAGEFSDVATAKFTNINKVPTFKLIVKGKKATVKLNKFDKAVDGYQIKYSSNKNFKRAKTVNTKTAKATLNGLDTTKVYYVKVRKFVKGAGKNVYGKFSKVKKIIYA